MNTVAMTAATRTATALHISNMVSFEWRVYQILCGERALPTLVLAAVPSLPLLPLFLAIYLNLQCARLTDADADANARRGEPSRPLGMLWVLYG